MTDQSFVLYGILGAIVGYLCSVLYLILKQREKR